MSNDHLPQRKHPRLKFFDYKKSGCYFLTLCTKDRKCILSRIVKLSDQVVTHDDITVKLTETGHVVEKLIINIDSVYENISVVSYVIMPDHVHLLISVNPQINTKNQVSIETVVRSLKRITIKEIGENIWQDSFYDHVVRNDEDLTLIRKYIQNNPLKFYFEKMI